MVVWTPSLVRLEDEGGRIVAAKYLLTTPERHYARLHCIGIEEEELEPELEPCPEHPSSSCFVQYAGPCLLGGGVLCTLGVTLAVDAVLVATGALCCSSGLLWVLCGLTCVALVVGIFFVYQGACHLSSPPIPISNVERLRTEAQLLRAEAEQYKKIRRVMDHSLRDAGYDSKEHIAKKIRDVGGCIAVALHVAELKDQEADQQEREEERQKTHRTP